MVLPQILQAFKSVKRFTGQGVEKNNDVARTTVLRKSNKWNSTEDVLKHDARLWELRDRERTKRVYNKVNMDYWEYSLHQARKNKRQKSAQYEELLIENIKDACEQFYNAPAGSCDILASDRGKNGTNQKGKGEWVINKYRDEAITTIQEQLQMTVEDHTRKQVQMHAVARNLTARFSAKVPEEFGKTFQYDKVFYSHWNECPVTVEEYVPGVFSKYINNDEDIIEPDDI
ncbi:transient receptor potential cation channel subfamily M member 6-like [Paramuricea clavata]|uniref:Transient receptor potential cation channel subfamily M member 6-like n=1 Tax=Paramuricea clavata TaxID=317549 RepID=A0A6S7JLQ1_PARCT|nr:transient receptor potential cation channel subfamily M member 6-like [Paramuricea clavata]